MIQSDFFERPLPQPPRVVVPDLPTRALTLWQPWAWLCATGIKTLENRPRGFSHKSFRGDFWIHAAAESKASIDSWWEARRLCEINGVDPKTLPRARDLAFGAIVGRATITGVLPVPDLCALPDGWRMADRFSFILTGARMLEKPVPCRGYQGFWNVPAEVMATLAESARRGEGDGR